MKKSKAVSKPGKVSGNKKKVKKENVSNKKECPGEEDIREKAKEIYHTRMENGESGTAEDDWHKAEAFFKS